jgi:hypothetical protein
VEATLSSETSVLTRPTRRHIPEDDILKKRAGSTEEPIKWCIGDLWKHYRPLQYDSELTNEVGKEDDKKKGDEEECGMVRESRSGHGCRNRREKKDEQKEKGQTVKEQKGVEDPKRRTERIGEKT